MSAYRPRQGKSSARRLADRAAQAAHRRKARLARAAAQVHTTAKPPRLNSQILLLDKPDHPVAIVQPVGVLALQPIPESVAVPARPDVITPLRALVLGAVAVVVAAVILTPQIRPHWLSLALVQTATGAGVAPEVTQRESISLPVAIEAPLVEVRAFDADAGPSVAASATANEVTKPQPAPTASSPQALSVISQGGVEVSIAAPLVEPALQHDATVPESPPANQPAAGTDVIRAAQCQMEEAAYTPTTETGDRGPPLDFGRSLAAAALSQTHDFTVYTDKYRTLAFPMGDVPKLFGVCTDVVIRAYRVLGIDLQARVYAARIGSGDRSIAHRRTFTLRRYFASRGASQPISDFAEDYRPGDIVTYYRPQNSGSRDHIAIVADVIGPSGRPMIIHNRGWGPQLEDALFVDKITGHYRYTQSQDRLAAAMTLKKAMKALKTTSTTEKDVVHGRRRVKAFRAIQKARAVAARGGIKE